MKVHPSQRKHLKKIRQMFLRVVGTLDRHITLTSLGLGIGSWVVTTWAVYMFERGSENANIQSYGDALWWGAVTLLTVGYGDLYPVTPWGRSVAVVLMFVGVLCIGLMTARVASFFLARTLREDKGMLDASLLDGHFIVCGWKDDLHDLLYHILDANPGLTSDKLVIVNNMSEEESQNLKTQKKFRDLKFVKGDFFSEVTLRRAKPSRAKKVLILADRSEDAAGRAPTITEADARTIMAAMTLSNIAKGTPVVAEILDSKMDAYLKLAHVSDIIYSRDYSRMLLGKASQGTGFSNIFHELMTTSGKAHLAIRPIPEAYLGRTFGEYKVDMEHSGSKFLLIGILENSGNGPKVKESAIRRAQKTANVGQLVDNLRKVKAMQFNAPCFHPAADHVILEGTVAIVIENNLTKGNHHVAAA